LGKKNLRYFETILSEQWEENQVRETGKTQYKVVGKDLFALRTDLLIRFDPELASHAQDFASDNALFLDTFAAAWTKVMNQDRFDGPTGNICDRAGCDGARTDAPEMAQE